MSSTSNVPKSFDKAEKTANDLAASVAETFSPQAGALVSGLAGGIFSFLKAKDGFANSSNNSTSPESGDEVIIDPDDDIEK